MRSIVKLFLVFIAAYTVVFAAFYTFQRDLLFQPFGDYVSASQAGFTHAVDVTITTEDGLPLRSWYASAKAGQKTIVFFHGNAGSIARRVNHYKQLYEAGFGVFALEYRGYSNNPGKPSETALYADARAAMRYLLQQQKLTANSIILMGRSLGSAIALKMATEYDVSAVFVISAYDSIATIAQQIYWFLPVKPFIKDSFNALSLAQHVRAPVYMLHGDSDTLTPISNAKRLFTAIHSPKKHFITLKDQGHNNIRFEDIVSALNAHIAEAH